MAKDLKIDGLSLQKLYITFYIFTSFIKVSTFFITESQQSSGSRWIYCLPAQFPTVITFSFMMLKQWRHKNIRIYYNFSMLFKVHNRKEGEKIVIITLWWLHSGDFLLFFRFNLWNVMKWNCCEEKEISRMYSLLIDDLEDSCFCSWLRWCYHWSLHTIKYGFMLLYPISSQIFTNFFR